MKRIALLLPILLFALSCGQMTPLEQANERIQQEIVKILPLPDSYDPIETILDSTFAPVESNEFTLTLQHYLEHRSDLVQLQTEADAYKLGLGLIKTSQNLFGTGDSDFSKAFSQEAKKKHLDYKKELNTIEARIDSTQHGADSLKTVILASLDAPKTFNGWRATHSYRSTDNDGKVTISKHVFIFNPEFTEISYSNTLEDYEKRIEGINTVIKYVKTGVLEY